MGPKNVQKAISVALRARTHVRTSTPRLSAAERRGHYVGSPPRQWRRCTGSKPSTIAQRRHSAIDMLSPVNYEDRYWERPAAA
jgi:hypothetical protein